MMRMVDLIEKKKRGMKHQPEEIRFIIEGYCHDKIPDYQMSAWLMAVYFQGLDEEETFYLTDSMMHSGAIVDLSDIQGVKVDKHSTGGVGDKTSLVLCPLVAACGIKVAKMSGRGLGHTGGTLDKLESIPHFNVTIPYESFIQQVNDIGFALIGQSDQLVKADKKLYALRDVSATVDHISLIASSIMSKKLASGCDSIVLDVKYGDGAFMKTKEDALKLAQMMVSIGRFFKKETHAIISNMDEPLGYAIGNTLEIKEVIDTLNGQGPKDLLELCLYEGSHMLLLGHLAADLSEARTMLEEAISQKKALEVFRQMVIYQQGDVRYIDHPELFKQARYITEIKSKNKGYIHKIKASQLGLVAMKLGGGRLKKEDSIDHSVGLVLTKKVSDYVEIDDVLVYVHSQSELSQKIIDEIYNAYDIIDVYKGKPILIEEVVD